MIKKNNGDWEVTIDEVKENNTLVHKVKRRMPKISVSETKKFKTRVEAIYQFQEWLK